MVKAAQDMGYNSNDVAEAFNQVGVNANCGVTPPSGNVLKNNTPVSNLTGNKGSEVFYTFTVDRNATAVVSISGGSGDADLYLKAGSKPTTKLLGLPPLSLRQQRKLFRQCGAGDHLSRDDKRLQQLQRCDVKAAILI
ncbi:Zinc metalloprotease, vibriolysin [Vibrio vulnificus]|nr:Zinc metalloprotease, vibriolysin [Vibrio vulnificus]